MPQPADPRSLFEPDPRGLSPVLDPCFPGWETTIAPYGWYRLRCFVRVMAEAGLTPHDMLDESLREAAVQAVPKAWKDFCPSFQANKESRWETLGTDRLVEIISGNSKKKTKLRQSEPSVGVSFQKAALALIALDIAASRKRANIDVYDRVRICPTLYLIEGFDESYWESMAPRARIRLRTISEQFDVNPLQLLAQGYPVTYGLANIVLDALQAGFPGEFELSRSEVLGKPKAGRRPNYRERLFCNN
jgi:hypothetical protein